MVKPKSANPHKIQVLALSDDVDTRIYSNQVQDNFPDIDLVISCGDLPFYYLEFVLDMLNVPTFFVHGNHDPKVEISESGEKNQPWGAVNLDNKIVRHNGFIMAGFEGCLRYSKALYEYTQFQMWIKVARVIPRLLLNRVIFGRYLDILVTHAPAWDVSDQPDPVHRGFKAFRWLLETFKPRYHLHGHIHIHDRSQAADIQFGDTLVINAHSYKRLELSLEVESDE
jgi:Icc-related predicted phosphoesterase